MKLLPYLLAAPLSAVSLLAGPKSTIESSPAAEADAFSWITPTLDIMARYEFRDVDGLDPSHAFTTRERVGLKFGDFHGFSAFVEGEFTQAIIDDYDAGPGSDISPNVANNSAILDPESAELNRVWLQYKGYDTTVKVGRQRIKLDNDAFIGNVGWRQNEQTFDAVRIVNTSIDDLTLDYTYSDRAQRIFGSDARGGLKEWEGDFHFFNAAYTGIDDWTLTAYAYLIDMDLGPARANGDTFGVIAKGKVGAFSLYGEVAQQLTNSGTADNVDDAGYFHLKASTKVGSQTVGLGYEYLDKDFYTPFSTVHAFNGFADVFIGQRLGLGPNNGLSNIYLFHDTKLPGGIVWKNWAYMIGGNDSGFDFGYEFDSVLVKKFGNGITAVGKFYHFESDSPIYPTTTGFTAGLGFKF